MYETYSNANWVYMLLSIALGGDMYRLIEKLGSLSENVARFYIGSLVLALQHLQVLPICSFSFSKSGFGSSSGRWLTQHVVRCCRRRLDMLFCRSWMWCTAISSLRMCFSILRGAT